jgi:hypothetical protein
LALNFNFKAASRSQTLTELVLRPWTKINGFKELLISGDINQSMRELLQQSNLQGPLPHDVAAYLTEYNSLAEHEFKRGNYDAARYWWALLEEHWDYVASLKPYQLDGRRICELGNELWEILGKFKSTQLDGVLKLVKACLRESKYGDAFEYTHETSWMRMKYGGWRSRPFGRKLTFLMDIKFNLIATLAGTALRVQNIENLNGFLRDAAIKLSYRSFESMVENMGIMRGYDLVDQLTEELTATLNNELIRLK